MIAFADANLYGAKQRGRHAVSSEAYSGGAETDEYGFGMLDSLITALSEKDQYTPNTLGASGVARCADRRSLGLDGNTIRALRIAGLLHDVGKTGIPASLLLRPGPLTAQESSLVRRHVDIGVALIRDVPELDEVLEAVRTHHERANGSGYPRGLKGEDVPLAGRILAVADSYSAMVLHHPYRRARTPEEARQELRRMAGSELDHRVVEVFLSLCSPPERDTEKKPLSIDGDLVTRVVGCPKGGLPSDDKTEVVPGRRDRRRDPSASRPPR